jgi:helicase
MHKIKISEKTDNPAMNLAFDTIKIGKQALVFVNTKRSAEKTAEEIAKRIKSSDDVLLKLSLDVVHSLSKPTKQCERLGRCVKKGIAFHHAGLTSKQKEIIENNFRSKKIKIICATPTLAVGIDVPAFRTILKDLKRYGSHGLAWIPVLEYLQMAGRAGRPKYDKVGESICIAATEPDKNKIYEKYITGSPEDIYSKLAVEPVLRTYLLSLIAVGFVSTKKEIIKFFGKTFWAEQFRDMGKIGVIIDRMLALLVDWEFIIGGGEEFQSANSLGNEKYKATLIGKRVAELYIDPLTAYSIICCLRQAPNLGLCFPYLQMISHSLEMKPLLRVRVKEQDKIQEALLKYGLLEDEPSIYDPSYGDFLSSVKTALMFNDWISEKDEEFLLEEYNVRPGEIKVKLDIGNWLLYCSEELSRMLQFKGLVRELMKLRIRVKYGVRAELIPLLKLKGVGRARARRLYFNEVRDIADVKKADLMKLRQILGEKLALDVKKQVGQEVKEIYLGKRKGQVSLKKF